MSTTLIVPFTPIIFERRQKSLWPISPKQVTQQSRLINSTTGKRKNMWYWFWGELSLYVRVDQIISTLNRVCLELCQRHRRHPAFKSIANFILGLKLTCVFIGDCMTKVILVILLIIWSKTYIYIQFNIISVQLKKLQPEKVCQTNKWIIDESFQFYLFPKTFFAYNMLNTYLIKKR